MDKVALLSILIALPFLSCNASANDHFEKILNHLAPKLDKKQLKSFKYKQCEIQKEKWVLLFATQTTFKESIKFSKRCDLQGSFTPRMGHFFPFTFEVANLKGIKQISGKMKVEIAFTDKTILKIEVIKANYRNEEMKIAKDFQLSYSFEIDPLNPSKIIKKDLGGKLDTISRGKITKSQVL